METARDENNWGWKQPGMEATRDENNWGWKQPGMEVTGDGNSQGWGMKRAVLRQTLPFCRACTQNQNAKDSYPGSLFYLSVLCYPTYLGNPCNERKG